jgi:hypothetical protein
MRCQFNTMILTLFKCRSQTLHSTTYRGDISTILRASFTARWAAGNPANRRSAVIVVTAGTADGSYTPERTPAAMIQFSSG